MTTITVNFDSIGDVELLAGILTSEIDTHSNWVCDALLRGDVERAQELARSRHVLVTRVRACVNRALMTHESPVLSAPFTGGGASG